MLDTWFSSWLWPISVFDGIRFPENDEIQYYYPTQDLVTGPDILFFWVARMIMSGYAFRNQQPFQNVYLTGLFETAKAERCPNSWAILLMHWPLSKNMVRIAFALVVIEFSSWK